MNPKITIGTINWEEIPKDATVISGAVFYIVVK